MHVLIKTASVLSNLERCVMCDPRVDHFGIYLQITFCVYVDKKGV